MLGERPRDGVVSVRRPVIPVHALAGAHAREQRAARIHER
jgi:hypothetical protein